MNAKVTLLTGIFVLALFGLGIAGEKSATIQVCATIPVVPGLNAPLVPDMPEAGAQDEAQTTQKTTYSQAVYIASAPVVRTTQNQIILAMVSTDRGEVETVYTR
jgi:hypothetical protein